MLYPYNAHLEHQERVLWDQMEKAHKEGDTALYEHYKAQWFKIVDRQWLNIEAHESKEHIEDLWNRNKQKMKEL